ncbi:hypothetical protein E1N52_08635 [Paraburkholderia guartelaensis]|jgi:hypothetical protein|uniref:Glycine zipper domain-containing protein n=1 Tax=Paraburkholderia guartelaensis TaxID=2546446 RepID=A0A4R5LII9_9BURK|nr:hypothetical protein [Paraburkholderia guartelaensis]TDG09178.1 hypothetical protein E1N52_08635 [Paraburkholderia guartelaensis]
MSLIVAGRFTTFPAAEAAAEKLYAGGFLEEDVNLFFVNPRGQHARHGAHETPMGAPPTVIAAHPHHTRNITAGAVAGAVVGVVIFSAFSAALPSVVIAAGVGAWIGARIGASVGVKAAAQQMAAHHERVHRETRSDGVLLSVHVCYENQDLAAQLLRDGGAADIECASGQWHDGHWADFDPTRPPMPFAAPTGQRI